DAKSERALCEVRVDFTVDSKIVLGKIKGELPFRSSLLNSLFADPNLVVAGFRQRQHLLDINENLAVEFVGPDPDTTDIQIPLIEPEDRSRQLVRKVSSDKHDANIVAEGEVIGFFPIEKLQQRLTWIVHTATAPQEGSVYLNYSLECDRGNHGCIPQRLQVHMPAVFRSLEFDDDVQAVVDHPNRIPK